MRACDFGQTANVLRVEFELFGVLLELFGVLLELFGLLLELFRLLLELAGHIVNGCVQ